MRIAEIFASRQGEGLLTGTPSVFIRTSGCNLRCWYCDTPYTSWAPEGDDLSVAEIMERVDALAEDHAVITGGEPMLFAELIPLADQLRASGRHITIETAGTLYLPIACDLMSISPKLAGSGPEEKEYPTWSRRHERTRHAPEVIRRLIAEHDYQIKFVVDAPEDCRSVESYLEEMKQIDRGRVMLMPQGVDREELERRAMWLKPYCREHGLRFCPRKHIEWYGNVRGT